MNTIKGCLVCHQMGTKATRELSPALGVFDSSMDAWERRLRSGQTGAGMYNTVTRLGSREQGLAFYADWTDRIRPAKCRARRARKASSATSCSRAGTYRIHGVHSRHREREQGAPATTTARLRVADFTTTPWSCSIRRRTPPRSSRFRRRSTEPDSNLHEPADRSAVAGLGRRNRHHGPRGAGHADVRSEGPHLGHRHDPDAQQPGATTGREQVREAVPNPDERASDGRLRSEDEDVHAGRHLLHDAPRDVGRAERFAHTTAAWARRSAGSIPRFGTRRTTRRKRRLVRCASQTSTATARSIRPWIS